ncbi:MAG: gliding motility-associated ABC transporter substrate-binding protein GldG [Bacteroidales bacterium]|nr:gliding motility-associated ABC transporter substrate-binding protein GldG [Bacteroidales bacterium]
MTNKKSIIRNNIVQLLLWLIIILCINIIGYYRFIRLDLTAEKRYTLSNTTKKLLKELDDIIFFRVYLEGEFPPGFKRLQNETKEMLDEFRAYSDNIQYEFINPAASKNKQLVRDNYKLLIEKGLEPTELKVKNNDGMSQQIIFPAALATYKDKEIPVTLLASQMGVPAELVLNNSIQSLEFSIANAIKKLTTKVKPSLAFIEGHKELNKYETADAMTALSEFFNVERIKIDEKVNSLRNFVDTTGGGVANKYDVIVIAKPDSIFSEKDKFIIDQYIMNGGRVLWLIDPVFASQDSLRTASFTYAIANNLNIEDMLFHYGVRLNTNLVMDLNALSIPVKTGDVGGQPQFEFMQWQYFPILIPMIKHPIVNNLNAIKTEFISSLDTIKQADVRKTIILTTSSYSKTINTPARISLKSLFEKPDEKMYNKKYLPVAVVLEGKFTSLYKNRMPPEIFNNKEIAFKEQSEPTRMIVMSDGDLIKNQTRIVNNQIIPFPLGYDKYTRQTFGNKDLILNAAGYLYDKTGLIAVRSKELQLRLLDRTKAGEYSTLIKIINTSVPVFLIIFAGIFFNFYRRRKYNKI